MALRNDRPIRGLKKAVQRAAACMLAALLLASAPDVASTDAFSAAAEAPRFSAELVKPGLYRISGPGGGTLLRLASHGLIVVDANRAGTYEALTAEIRRIARSSDVPVGALALTAAGPDQAGNVAQFLDAGVPVVVQRHALERLAPSTAARRPTLISYESDYLLRVGDAAAEIEHVGSGRSGTDSVVLFPDLRVVAVGDLFTSGAPEPDCASGGSFAGWAAAISHVLWSDFDIAVPSRGAPVGKRELAALQARLEALARRADASAAGPADCPRPR
jgi:hypothetical protein